MLVPAVVAALAALPLASAQSGFLFAQTGIASAGIPNSNATSTRYSSSWGFNSSVPKAVLSGTSAATTSQVTLQVTAQATTTATRCTTRYGFNSTTQVDTWYSYQAPTTSTTSLISTTRDTVTVTPEATTYTNVLTTTQTVVTTTTNTPAATTVPTPAGFAPLLLVDLAQPTAFQRYRRYDIEARDSSTTDVAHPLKRQTAPGNSGGYIAYRNGTYAGLYRRYPHRVDCRVGVTVDETVVLVVQDPPETVVVAQGTATALSTLTVATTTTVVEVAPTPTVYAACLGNNVVKNITDVGGNVMTFDRVIYRPDEGYPIANELVVNTTTAERCCVACQNTPYCAGSFYVPGNEDEFIPAECHLRLTQPFLPAPPPPNPSASAIAFFSGNGSFPTAAGTATGVVALAPLSTATPGNNGTCKTGSRGFFLGTIRGQEDFPEKYALTFSNGPCGRFSVNPIPLPGPDAVNRRALGAGKL